MRLAWALSRYYPMAEGITSMLQQAQEGCPVPLRAAGCTLVLGNAATANFLIERCYFLQDLIVRGTLVAARPMPPFQDQVESGILAVYDGLPIVHRAGVMSFGGTVVLPEALQPACQVDHDILLSIYRNISQSAA